MTISSLKLIFKHKDAILKKQPDEVLRIEDTNHVIVFDSADSSRTMQRDNPFGL